MEDKVIAKHFKGWLNPENIMEAASHAQWAIKANEAHGAGDEMVVFAIPKGKHLIGEIERLIQSKNNTKHHD